MKKIIYNALLLLFGGLLVFSGWKVLGILNTYREGQDAYADMEQYVQLPTSTVSVPEETEPTSGPVDETVWPEVDFAALAQVNPDVVGWIFIEGTSIHYPIVQGGDNSYYLNHLFDGTRNAAGCIFLDVACEGDFSDAHSILYGHHMKNGTMFASLVDYKEQVFYDQHPTALLLTPTGKYQVHFFSGYVADNDAGAWETDFEEDTFETWLTEISSRSLFTPATTPEPTHRILTLSTCTYEFNSAKFLLHGYVVQATKLE